MCPDCQKHLPMDDPMHTRKKGDCAYPHVLPFLPKCPACKRRDHTNIYGECRWASGHTPQTRQRRGSKPHEMLPPDDAEPTARLSPSQPDGRPIGTDEEEEIRRRDREREKRPSHQEQHLRRHPLEKSDRPRSQDRMSLRQRRSSHLLCRRKVRSESDGRGRHQGASQMLV